MTDISLDLVLFLDAGSKEMGRKGFIWNSESGFLLTLK
jgi:hypothetical protein